MKILDKVKEVFTKTKEAVKPKKEKQHDKTHHHNHGSSTT